MLYFNLSPASGISSGNQIFVALAALLEYFKPFADFLVQIFYRFSPKTFAP